MFDGRHLHEFNSDIVTNRFQVINIFNHGRRNHYDGFAAGGIGFCAPEQVAKNRDSV